MSNAIVGRLQNHAITPVHDCSINPDSTLFLKKTLAWPSKKQSDQPGIYILLT